MSTTRRTKGVFASPPPKNEKGEKVCRNCHGPLPKGRKYHNCSNRCSEEWALKTSPGLMRRAVYLRDRGVCAACGADTQAQKIEYRAAMRKHHTAYCIPMKELRERLQVTVCQAGSGHWWEADHITPVIEGGGECGLEGYRTLCISCHKKATKELRGRMSKARREQKAVENDRAGLFADQVEA